MSDCSSQHDALGRVRLILVLPCVLLMLVSCASQEHQEEKNLSLKLVQDEKDAGAHKGQEQEQASLHFRVLRLDYVMDEKALELPEMLIHEGISERTIARYREAGFEVGLIRPDQFDALTKRIGKPFTQFVTNTRIPISKDEQWAPILTLPSQRGRTLAERNPMPLQWVAHFKARDLNHKLAVEETSLMPYRRYRIKPLTTEKDDSLPKVGKVFEDLQLPAVDASKSENLLVIYPTLTFTWRRGEELPERTATNAITDQSKETDAPATEDDAQESPEEGSVESEQPQSEQDDEQAENEPSSPPLTLHVQPEADTLAATWLTFRLQRKDCYSIIVIAMRQTDQRDNQQEGATNNSNP